MARKSIYPDFVRATIRVKLDGGGFNDHMMLPKARTSEENRKYLEQVVIERAEKLPTNCVIAFVGELEVIVDATERTLEINRLLDMRVIRKRKGERPTPSNRSRKSPPEK